jgi:photosystem II stability/assembly factor-like uncharacterized protein
VRSYLTVFEISILVILLAGCGASGTPQPTASPATPEPTASLPAAPATPALIEGLSDVHMINSMSGWAWTSEKDNRFALLHTTDGGWTWTDVTPRELPFVPDGSFILDAETAWLQLYDPTPNTSGLARTTDGGKTWSRLSNALAFASSGFQVQFLTPLEGWAESVDIGAGNASVQLYQTGDGGTLWKQIMVVGPASDPTASDGTLHLCNICGDRLYYDPARLIITHGDLATNPGGGVRLDVSSDLGRNWTSVQLNLPASTYAPDLIVPGLPVFFNQNEGLLPVQMQDPNSSGQGTAALALYLTHDGGRTWQPSPSVLEKVNLFDSVDAVSPLDVFVTCGSNLCATHDGAWTWTTLTSDLNFASSDTQAYVSQFDFVSPTIGWALSGKAGSFSLYETKDGGVNWVRLSPALLP